MLESEERDIRRSPRSGLFSSKSELHAEKTMDKAVAETSAIAERKAEESAEASEPKADLPEARECPASDVDAQTAPEESAVKSEPKTDLLQTRECPAGDVDAQTAPEESAEAPKPKTDLPQTRKRPASDVDAPTAPDANASRAGEPKKSKTLWNCDKEMSAFDVACDGIKKEWDRASGEGRELSTLIRDTDDWNHDKFESVAKELIRVSREYMSKPELKGRYEELKEMVDKGMDRFDALRHWTGDAIQMVRNGECEEDLLEQMNGLTRRLREMREDDWVWHASS